MAMSLFGDPFFSTALNLPQATFPTFAEWPTTFARDMDWPLGETRTMRNLKAAVDVIERPDSYIFRADMPGMKKENVRVHLDGRTLSIGGERTREEVREDERFHLVERTLGRFERQFKLPPNADVDKIDARCEDGVLTVHVPKRPGEELPKAADIAVRWKDEPAQQIGSSEVLKQPRSEMEQLQQQQAKQEQQRK
eukprot:jgi/Mesvir1/26322/Mv22502-RA.1